MADRVPRVKCKIVTFYLTLKYQFASFHSACSDHCSRTQQTRQSKLNVNNIFC